MFENLIKIKPYYCLNMRKKLASISSDQDI